MEAVERDFGGFLFLPDLWVREDILLDNRGRKIPKIHMKNSRKTLQTQRYYDKIR